MKKILCLLLAMLMLLGLCACGQSAAPGADASAPAEADAQEVVEEAPDVAYSISVVDTEGNPIPGVTVQFCDDISCKSGETDENGSAVFTAKEGTYTAHILAVPAGVVGTDEEFTFSDEGREAQIALKTLELAIDEPKTGFSYYNPEKYEDNEGVIDWEVYPVSYDVYVLDPVYYAVPKDDTARYNELKNNAKSSNYAVGTLFDVICVQMDESKAEEYLRDNIQPRDGWDAYNLEKIASAEKLTCFLAQENISEKELGQYKAAMGELYDEFAALREDKETFISGIRLYTPVPEILMFETQDLDGNTVNLADVFAGHKVTMVNLWETGCVPCKQEMPGLEKLNKALEEQNCQIIGICLDCFSGSDTTEVKDILNKAGVTYLNLAAPTTYEELLQVTSFPTSYFVDSEGKVLTSPVPYAYTDVENYRYHFEEALSRIEG